MAKQNLTEQLDNAVEAILARRDRGLPLADSRLQPLLRVATDLRGLPGEGFRARLKTELQRRAAMTTKTVRPIREGFHTITPYLAVREANALIDFVNKAFGAETTVMGTGSQGGLHAEGRIGDSMVMIGGGEAWRGTPMPTAVHLYVQDADAAYRRALAAGATSLYEPVDQDYGDREGGVKDLAGNHWYIGTHKATGYMPEGFHSVTVSLHPKGAAQLIDFLKPALGAEEVAREQALDGTIKHAKIRIGDSILELGEAHGAFQPMPTVFFLYVDDVDAWYRRAIEAGAASMGEPAEQPYGERMAAVRDSFGNQWYMATHVKDVSG